MPELSNSELVAEKLTVSEYVFLESETADGVVLYQAQTRARVKLSRALYECIIALRHAGDAKNNALSRLVSHREGVACLTRLLDRGFLLQTPEIAFPAGATRPLRPARETLFSGPQGSPDADDAQVVVVGVPYESGTAINAGVRKSPSVLRQRSGDFEYRRDPFTGAPLGWFDIENDEYVASGIRVSDWGDIRVDPGDPPRIVFERLEQVIDIAAKSSKVPVVIGGDHSVSWAAIKGMRSAGPITVVWFDSYTDYGWIGEGATHNDKNVLNAIAALEHVANIIIVGHRGFTRIDKTEKWPRKYEKVRIVPCRLVRETATPLLAMLPDSQPCYVSIDANVMSPACMPGVAALSPDGLSALQLRLLLREVGAARAIRGLDVVNVNPEIESQLTATQTLHILITGIHALGRHLSRLEVNGAEIERDSEVLGRSDERHVQCEDDEQLRNG